MIPLGELRKLIRAAAPILKDAALSGEALTASTELTYDAGSGELRQTHVFDQDTELSGYMKLRLWVEARSARPSEPAPDDMVLFVGVEKLDARGRPVRFYGSVGNRADLVTRGLLAVSRRALDDAASTEWEPVLLNQRDEKLRAGQIVPVEIALNPSSTFFRSGEGIQIVVAPNEIVPSPPYVKANDRNRGVHVVHVGGPYDSHLLIPVP